MTSEITGYREAVQTIKTAILQAQYAAVKSANAQQLQLYFAVGGYISAHTRHGVWGTGALKTISSQLQRELPGLRGFSERNMYYMKAFYEEWSGNLVGDDAAISAFASAEFQSLFCR